MPMVGDVMVFGEGYILEGKYESSWIDFGSPNTPKNFDTAEWEGIVPDGTKITIQTQTVSSLADTSEWSSPVSTKSFKFASPEPAASFRYRVNLQTQVGTITPVFKKLNVTYSTDATLVEKIEDSSEPFINLECYPNPFNSVTMIKYDIPKNSHVILTIYNTLGQAVTVLKDEFQTAGNYSVSWNATGLPSGLYFSNLRANGFTETREILLVK